MKSIARSFARLALIGCIALSVGSAYAIDYPTRAVHLVVGFAAGGPTDILARVVAERLSQQTGQQFVVENRAGGGGNVAAEVVLNAPRDGYTLLVATTSNAINMTFRPSLSFNFTRDMTPVAGLARVYYVVAVSPSVPAKSIAELIAYAKVNPGKVNYGSGGIGASNHLAPALLGALTGIELTHIPYQGNAAAYSDLMAGRIQLLFADPASALQYVRTGALRGLAVTSARRAPELPELPTVAETVPGFEASAWYGFAAPKGVAVEIVDKLNAEINASLADPKIKARLDALGAQPMIFSSAEFAAFTAAEAVRWGEAVKAAGLKAE